MPGLKKNGGLRSQTSHSWEEHTNLRTWNWMRWTLLHYTAEQKLLGRQFHSMAVWRMACWFKACRSGKGLTCLQLASPCVVLFACFLLEMFGSESAERLFVCVWLSCSSLSSCCMFIYEDACHEMNRIFALLAGWRVWLFCQTLIAARRHEHRLLPHFPKQLLHYYQDHSIVDCVFVIVGISLFCGC